MSTSAEQTLRPVRVCRALLEALEATEGRRRRRKRNTSADAIGIGMKRELLEAAVRDDPDPGAFEGWLMERCFEKGRGEGAWRAMALDIFQEWRMAAAAPSFRSWLEAGAPSDDKPARGLPVLPGLFLLIALGATLPACDDGDPDYGHPVPTMDVTYMEEEERQRTGTTAFVLAEMKAGPGPDSTIYDRPVNLARPVAATNWPPATGFHGDKAAGRVPPEEQEEGEGGEQGDGADGAADAESQAPPAEAAPDTAGAGTGGSNVPPDPPGPGG